MIFPALNLTVARRNHKTTPGLVRISSYARLGQAWLKHPEVAQLDGNIFGQTVGDLVEGSLNYIKDLVLHQPRLDADSADDVAFD
jgi:hypothetical protein